MKSLDERLMDALNECEDFKTADVLTDLMLDRRILINQNTKMLELLKRFRKDVKELLAVMGEDGV